MPTSEHEETASEALAPTSRRTFLGLAAMAGGAGLGGAPATAVVGDGNVVSVLASPEQRDVVRAVADRLRSAGSGTTISLDVAETAPAIRSFATGEVDVVAGGRPLLPTERSRASEHGVDLRIEELPTHAGAVTRPDASWVDPLRPKRIAETWSTSGPVSTWAEAPSSEGGVDDALPTTGDAAAVGDADETVLVRGTRATQYARGRGGVGYYQPEWDWLRSDVDATNGDAASDARVVRLAYLGLDRRSLRTATVEDVVSAFEAASTARVGDVPFFEDPYGVTAT